MLPVWSKQSIELRSNKLIPEPESGVMIWSLLISVMWREVTLDQL